MKVLLFCAVLFDVTQSSLRPYISFARVLRFLDVDEHVSFGCRSVSHHLRLRFEAVVVCCGGYRSMKQANGHFPSSSRSSPFSVSAFKIALWLSITVTT